METKREPTSRVNTRIFVSQQKYIKALAKKTGKTEGELYRAIVAEHIRLSKK